LPDDEYVLFGMVDIVAPLVRATMSGQQMTKFVESMLRLTEAIGDTMNVAITAYVVSDAPG
jgi:hypothetical protein